MIVNATRGLSRIDEKALDLFRSLSATRTQVFLKLRLPNSLPSVFSALKISSSLSIVGAIVGEFVGAQHGLGYLIVVASYHLETELMFVAILSAAVGGVAFFGAISLAEKALVPWSESTDAAM
jgi:NitT/TauT family transport system permease protein